MRSTEVLGCWLHERWRTECALSPALGRLTGIVWQDLCNRHERLLPGSDARSRVCDWADSSWLTVARVFPRAGARLLAHCLREWPVRFSAEPLSATGNPRLSVVIPVGGADRISQFHTVLRSFFSQSEQKIEIIAVEHADTSLYRDACLGGARYVHVHRAPGAHFNKSAAMNAGVREARSDVVLLHDGDVVVPEGYVRSILDRVALGWEAVRPIRFLFLLDKASSGRFVSQGELPRSVSEVQQHNPGLSTAVRHDVYWAIGGHDERFEGWGGEDNEFLDRLQTRRLFAGAYAPGIHLWHAAAPKKSSGDRNQSLAAEIRQRSPQERIASLVAHQREVSTGVGALP